jgi:cytochrome c oxidase subunit 4
VRTDDEIAAIEERRRDSARPGGDHSAREGHGAPSPVARVYTVIWATLVVLTGVTVGVTFLDMKNFAVVTAVIIATVKASLVFLYFMHLRYESRLFLIMVLIALATFAVFIGLTFTDIEFRYL